MIAKSLLYAAIGARTLPTMDIARALATALLPQANAQPAISNEQIKLLYANLRVSQSVALVNGAVLAIVQSAVVEKIQVLSWFASLGIVTALRALLGLRFARVTEHGGDLLPWGLYFLAGAVASALVWGATAFVLYPLHSVVHQVFLAFVLGGMVAGSVTTLTPVYAAFALYAIGTLVPIIARFAYGADEVHLGMTAMAIVFLIAMLAIGKRIHATITRSLQLGFQNRDLIAHLTQEKTKLDATNAELVAAQEALKRSNEALERRVEERTAALWEQDRRKDEFLAMLGHELRNPLAPMSNALYLLRATGPEGSALPHAQAVLERQLQMLVRLVDDLVDVSRINEGRIELRREPLELAQVIRHAVETAQPVIDQHGHALDVDLSGERLHVMGDPIRLAQVISNLLTNAAKYTPKPDRITLTLSREGSRAIIAVKDEGIGISPELMPRIFDLFVQGDHSLARTRGGLGIGLTLVRKLVKMHDGDVSAYSLGTDQGSEFRIDLPLISEPAQRKAATEEQTPSTSKHRVLVVDDNADAANSLCSILRLFGHDVRCAYDGASALSLAGEFRPDVILLDIGLPGMNGYEVARRLRARPEFAAITLVAVTGYGQESDRIQAQQSGFDRHLTKPVEAEEIHRLITALAAARGPGTHAA